MLSQKGKKKQAIIILKANLIMLKYYASSAKFNLYGAKRSGRLEDFGAATTRAFVELTLSITRTALRKTMGLRGSIIFLLARLVPSLFGLVTAAVLTRLLEPAVYGLYALGLSITFFLALGVFDWLGLSLLRMAPAIKQPDVFFGTVLACFCALCG